MTWLAANWPELLWVLFWVAIGGPLLPAFMKLLERFEEWQTAKRWGRRPEYEPWSWF